MIEWIKCSERKPDHGQMVICNGNRTYCCEEDMNKSWYHVARYNNIPISWDKDMNPIDFNDIFYVEDLDLDHADHVENVTHWAEFSEPPKKEFDRPFYGKVCIIGGMAFEVRND